MLRNKQYLYIYDLEILDSHRPIQEEFVLQHSTYSPLNFFQWRLLLADHPDTHFKRFILEGIKSGFQIGFNLHQPLKPAIHNMPSEVPSMISEYFQREVSLVRIVRLSPFFQHPGVQISPLGIVPKKNKAGKWRLIVDFSSPAKANINNGISEQLSSLTYVSADHLFALIRETGSGAFLTKADIKEAYRMLQVHPHDCHLREVHWERSIFIDQTLPFGLRPAPKYSQ